MVLVPGAAMSIVSSVAPVTTWMNSITYAELPMPAASLP
jgi:hypothetical protein